MIPLVLESARVFAERLMQQSSSPEEKITLAFRSIVCRNPKDAELNKLIEYYKEEVAAYTAAPEEAKKFIKAGEYPHAGNSRCGFPGCVNASSAYVI